MPNEALYLQQAVESCRHPAKVLAITGGKGGVGKSLVAGLLAVALRREGHQVGILDADLHGSHQASDGYRCQYDDPESPPSGQGFAYLVRGRSLDCGAGTLGYDSFERERFEAEGCTAASAGMTRTGS